MIFFAEPNLVSVRPDTGDLLWRFTFRFSTSTAASPVVGIRSIVPRRTAWERRWCGFAPRPPGRD